MASDNESNVSEFIRCNDTNITHLYMSVIENMELIKQDLLKVRNNLERISVHSGPLESQLRALLRALPQPDLQLHMETD